MHVGFARVRLVRSESPRIPSTMARIAVAEVPKQPLRRQVVVLTILNRGFVAPDYLVPDVLG